MIIGFDYFLYFDAFLNVFCVGLMFKFNNYWYRDVFCKLCNKLYISWQVGLELASRTSQDQCNSSNEAPPSSLQLEKQRSATLSNTASPQLSPNDQTLNMSKIDISA
eukprot:UN07282